ncbi:MAG: endonuclease NucS [Burkholderiaceae bacterium]|nr:endonuclease NucS [Burkholderiaceae bacterium]
MSEPEHTVIDESGNPILERQIQRHLSNNLHKLGIGRLTLVAEEFPVAFGRIDILAKNDDGAFIVIECKRGVATRDAVGQVQSYMGALMTQYPQQKVYGVVVAQGLDDGAKAAIAAHQLVTYCECNVTVSFEFTTDWAKSKELVDLLPKIQLNSAADPSLVESTETKQTTSLYIPKRLSNRRDVKSPSEDSNTERKSYLSEEEKNERLESSFMRYLKSKSAEFTQERSTCKRCKRPAIFAKHSGHFYCTLCGASQPPQL